jgi:hypothetical protein
MSDPITADNLRERIEAVKREAKERALLSLGLQYDKMAGDLARLGMLMGRCLKASVEVSYSAQYLGETITFLDDETGAAIHQAKTITGA